MHSIWQMIRVCYLAAFAPDRFHKADLLDEAERSQHPASAEPPMQVAEFKKKQLAILRSGWITSLGLMTYAAVVGLLLGRIALKEVGERPGIAMLVGVCGGVLLLWSAIALRGWEIQTTDGETLTEKVNVWVVRAACIFGTTLAVISVSWDASF